MKIPDKDTIESRIEKRMFHQKPREYLGMSGIGHPCMKRQWYGFRWTKFLVIQARVNRIFRRGDLEEPRIVADLEREGVKVFDDQEECVGFEKYVKGHIDGKALGLPESPKTVHLLEFKTMNDKAFNGYRSKKDNEPTGASGVINLGVKAAKPIYYAQMQIYMHYLKLKRALFIVSNKNDEHRYYERVRYDSVDAKELVLKAKNIVTSPMPPVSTLGPTSFECRFCDFSDACYMGHAPEITCRSCERCDLIGGGKWACSRNNNVLSFDEQLDACQFYKRLF